MILSYMGNENLEAVECLGYSLALRGSGCRVSGLRLRLFLLRLLRVHFSWRLEQIPFKHTTDFSP